MKTKGREIDILETCIAVIIVNFILTRIIKIKIFEKKFPCYEKNFVLILGQNSYKKSEYLILKLNGLTETIRERKEYHNPPPLELKSRNQIIIFDELFKASPSFC